MDGHFYWWTGISTSSSDSMRHELVCLDAIVASWRQRLNQATLPGYVGLKNILLMLAVPHEDPFSVIFAYILIMVFRRDAIHVPSLAAVTVHLQFF